MIRLSNNRTPLETVYSLTDEQIRFLHSLWIQSVEELDGCITALEAAHEVAGEGFKLPGFIPDAAARLSAMPDGASETIRSVSVQRLPTGLAVSPSVQAGLMQAYRQAVKAGGARRASPSFLSAAAPDIPGLPPEVSLLKGMLPVRNQFHRGTCAAFAAAALFEYLENSGVQLSPQFLYCCCKERDGEPDEAGTLLAVVQEAAREDGICPEEDWPYYPDPVTGPDGRCREGQGPAPEIAVLHARDRRHVCGPLAPGAVLRYKKILASGCPVVLGVLVFASWERSWMSRLTGKITMPLYRVDENGEVEGEEPEGAHAMCLAGYVDDASVAGGGYFLVRNSWGAEWASESPVAPGYAMLPYAYVEQFTTEAFTSLKGSGILPEEAGAGTAGAQVPPGTRAAPPEPAFPRDAPGYLRPFARVLESEARDAAGALLPAGAWVLSLPDPGAPLLRCSPQTFQSEVYREELARILERVRFANAPDNAILARREVFSGKLDRNLTEALGSLFPDTRFSLALFQSPWTPRIKRVRVVADFAAELLDALLDDALSGARHKFLAEPRRPAAWKEKQLAAVTARIWRCSAFTPPPPFFTPSVYVVEVFATPFKVCGETGAFVPTEPAQRFVDIARACARCVLDKLPKAPFTFFSIGAGLPWDGPAAAVTASGSESVVVSAPRGVQDDRWRVEMPSYLTGRASYRNFQDRLLPLTREDLVSAVKRGVDDEIRDGGVMKTEEAVETLHAPDSPFRDFPRFRKTAVLRAFVRLAANNPVKYAVCRDAKKKGDVYILEPASVNPKQDKPYRQANRLYRFLQRHLLGLFFCVPGVLLFFGKTYLLDRLGITGRDLAVSFALTVCFAYLGILLQNFINRIRNTTELE